MRCVTIVDFKKDVISGRLPLTTQRRVGASLIFTDTITL
jgi:hypothetical protein